MDGKGRGNARERSHHRQKRKTSKSDRMSDQQVTGRALAQEKTIKDLRRGIVDMEEVQAEQDTALLLATQFQQRAHEDRLNLKDIISVRDARIASLSSQLADARADASALTAKIYGMTHAASWDMKTGAALEAQAQVHLALVSGLKSRISAAEEEVKRSRNDLAQASEENKSLEAVVKVHEERAVKETRITQAALAKAAELEQIAQDQQGLIKRLMADP